MKSILGPRTGLLVALMAVLPGLCYWEVFDGKLLLPMQWVYRDVEPWRQLGEPPEVTNDRLKDAFRAGYSLDLVSARAAREGRVALWNPYMGGGTPHFATGFTRMLYPPFWIYAILPPEVARNVEILLHVFLAELFAFLFLRRIGCGTGGALVGAIAFGFSPSITHRSEIPFILPSLIWYPLLLLFVEELVADGRFRAFVGLSAAVSLQLLAGHYPDIAIHFLGAAIYGLARLVAQRSPTVIAAGVLRCLAAVALGASLAAPFLLPSLELIQQSNRPVTSLDELVRTGLGWDVVRTLFTPWLTRSQVYFGVIALIFVPAAFIGRGRTRASRAGDVPDRGVALALLAVTLVVVGIASGSPLLSLLHEVAPGFNRLQYVHTMISVAAYSLAFLAAVGFSRASASNLKLERAFAIALLAAGAAVTAWSSVAGQPDLLPQFRLPGILVLVLLLAIGLEASRRKLIGVRGLSATVCVLLAVELMSFARKYNPRVDPVAYEPFPTFPSIEFLLKDDEPYRVATLRGESGRRPFWQNSLSAYGVEDVGSYHSLVPRRVGAYMQRARFYTVGASPRQLADDVDPATNLLQLDSFRPSNLLRAWNIKYFILPRGEENPDPRWLELVYDDEVRIFRLKNWLPRAWLTRAALVLPGDQGVYQKLVGPGFDPGQTVLLEQEPGCYLPSVATTHARERSADTVEIVESHEERKLFEAHASGLSYLVISETYDPGWKASVNERETPIFRANANFIAVPLGPGRSRVVLEYEPASYAWGWVSCGLGIAGLVLAFWLRRGRRVVGIKFLWMSLLPGTIGFFGWQAQMKRQAVPSCGHFRVAKRLLHPGEGRFVELSNGTFLGASIDAGSQLSRSLPDDEGGIVRVRLALRDGGGTPTVTRVVAPRPDEEPEALIAVRASTHRRWLTEDVIVPSGVSGLTFRINRRASSVLVGAPILLRLGSSSPSVALFIRPGAEGWRDAIPELGDESRMRVLLSRTDDGSFASADFDEIYPSSTRARLGARLLSLAPDLYRFSTVLVVHPERSHEDGSFTTRQMRLLENELSRLGIGTDRVEVRIYPVR